jgi:hypothetical protein
MSVLATRLPHYILPAYPAAALGVAGLYAELSSRVGLDRRAFGALVGPILAMLVLIEGRMHPGDLYLLQRPWGRELGTLAQRITERDQTLYLYEWNGHSLGYYAQRPIMLLTEQRRRFDVVKVFTKTIRFVPPPPEPVGCVVYIAGEAPLLANARWLKVEQAVGHSPPMFLVRARITAFEPSPPGGGAPGTAPP